MTPVPFAEANRTLTRPGNMSADECSSLPIHNDGRTCISCWQMSPEELVLAHLNGGRVYMGIMSGTTQPPAFLSVVPPFPAADIAEVRNELTPEYDDALRQFAERLPHRQYANDKPMTGALLTTLDHTLRTPNGGYLIPDKLYFVGGPVIAAEHLELLRAAYARGGKAAVVAYLLPYVHFLGTEAKPVV
jgi:hypothetical protein